MKKQLIVALAALTTLSSVAMADAYPPCTGWKDYLASSFGGIVTGGVRQVEIPPMMHDIDGGDFSSNHGNINISATATNNQAGEINAVISGSHCKQGTGAIGGQLYLNYDKVFPYTVIGKVTTTSRDAKGHYHGEITIHSVRAVSGESGSPSFMLYY